MSATDLAICHPQSLEDCTTPHRQRRRTLDTALRAMPNMGFSGRLQRMLNPAAASRASQSRSCAHNLTHQTALPRQISWHSPYVSCRRNVLPRRVLWLIRCYAPRSLCWARVYRQQRAYARGKVLARFASVARHARYFFAFGRLACRVGGGVYPGFEPHEAH